MPFQFNSSNKPTTHPTDPYPWIHVLMTCMHLIKSTFIQSNTLWKSKSATSHAAWRRGFGGRRQCSCEGGPTPPATHHHSEARHCSYSSTSTRTGCGGDYDTADAGGRTNDKHQQQQRSKPGGDVVLPAQRLRRRDAVPAPDLQLRHARREARTAVAAAAGRRGGGELTPGS